MFGSALLAVVAASASLVAAQEVWDKNQVNTKICQWQQLRGNIYGNIYTLNLSTPFNTTQNISAILGTLSKTGGGGATNLAPNYYDGALLGNHEEFFLFGGLVQRTAAYAPPPGDTVLGYQAYQYSGLKEIWRPQFINKALGDGLTRYIAYGGGASAPSEKLAWYFSGFKAPGGGPVYVKSSNRSITAVDVSSTLITLNLETQQREVFTNVTLPPDIPGRANPELVWVPVGTKGILVALGGVIYPDFENIVSKSINETASRATSPGFMSTIDIYDVASGEWYRQKTLTRGCAVVATAQDGSSFNIYYYGGYDGLRIKETGAYSDDVWVLSLPSFIWVKVASSDVEGRAGHKCVTPYPDQMFVIGGNPAFSGTMLRCLKETIRVLNLSTGKWLDRYDPAVYANYTVPSTVVEKIGGSGTGGATATSPSPSGFDDEGLGKVFAIKYTGKTTTYYPYASAAPTNNTNPNAPPTPEVEEQGGAVLILLWRRRKLLRRGAGTISEAGTEETNGHRIILWLRGQPSLPAKALTTTSSENSPTSGTTNVSSVATPLPQRTIAEMMNTEVQPPVELPDTSPPAELHDGNTYIATYAALNDTAKYPTTHQTDYACSSPVSISDSPPHNPTLPTRPHRQRIPVFPYTSTPTSSASAAPQHPAEMPTFTTTTNPARANVQSGISDFSDRERAHLRQMSGDTTVSSRCEWGKGAERDQ
ncbi:hypothetical protein N0V88_005012 [Collariella sp. IMI 366227]|nr:hypothetical protein N0V88_005012 [Collariella sp. IMI 366227]